MKFALKVVETYGRTFIIEADELWEAQEKLQDACSAGQINLSYDDFIERDVVPSDRFEGGVVPEGRDVSYFDQYKNYVDEDDEDDYDYDDDFDDDEDEV